MPSDCPAVAAPTVGSPVEDIPLQAERCSGGGPKVFALPPEQCSPSDRNAVRDHNGIVFGFTAESRSPSTGFRTVDCVIEVRSRLTQQIFAFGVER
jgi:hypothetical protein